MPAAVAAAPGVSVNEPDDARRGRDAVLAARCLSTKTGGKQAAALASSAARRQPRLTLPRSVPFSSAVPWLPCAIAVRARGKATAGAAILAATALADPAVSSITTAVEQPAGHGARSRRDEAVSSGLVEMR